MGAGAHLILWKDRTFALVIKVIGITVLNVLLDYCTLHKNAIELHMGLLYQPAMRHWVAVLLALV